MDIERADVNETLEKREIYRRLRNKRKRNYILNGLTIILAIGALIWAVNIFLRYYKYEITNDATIEQYISPINVKVSGYVKSINFTDHQYVHAGDTLLVIDDREYKIKLLDAIAALKDAEASKSILKTTIQTTQVNIGVSKANLKEAEVRVWKSEQDYLRYKNLLAADAVSEQQFEQIKTEYEAMKAHYQALQKQETSVASVSSETEKKLISADAVIARREADLEMAKLNESYTIVVAPYAGYVGRRTLEDGQLIQAGQTVTNLVKSQDKWVIANYREKQIENIYIGQPIDIKVDAIQNKVFKGKVTAISEATGSKYSLLPTDNSAGNFVKIQQRIPVRIDFEDVSDEDMSKLRAGMMVITEAIK